MLMLVLLVWLKDMGTEVNLKLSDLKFDVDDTGGVDDIPGVFPFRSEIC